MSYNKVHSDIGYENLPSVNTALEADNLNYTDHCVDILDDRIVWLDANKLGLSDANNLVESITMDDDTGIFTITKKDGSSYTIDTKLEKIAVNFRYDTATQKLIITLDDGTTQEIDLSSLITENEFVDSSAIAFSVVNHVVSATIKSGSVTEDMLETDFLANCQLAQGAAELARDDAEDYADDSEASALVSEGWAVGKQDGVDVPSTSPYYHNNAKYFAERTGGVSLEALNDVTISNKQPDDSLVWDEDLGKWVNKDVSTKFATLPVTNLNAVAGDSQVTLSWTNPEDVVVGGTKVAELELIKVYRDGALVERALLSTYTDTGLVNGQTYVYTVVAETTKGVESAVATISATPVATGVAVTITNAGANASVTVTDGTDTYTATADASGNASVAVSASGTYTITANGTGENKRYATEVVVSDEAVSVKMLNVPKQYKEVAYIESHGTEAIILNYVPTIPINLHLRFDALEVPPTGTSCQFLNGAGTGIGRFDLFFDEQSLFITRIFSNGFTTIQNAAVGSYTVDLQYTSRSNYSYKINNTSVALTGNEVSTGYGNLAIFNTASLTAPAKMKLYDFSIEGACRLIPVVLTFSGEAGLYDTVNDVFYTNKGTGAFGYEFLQDDPDPVIRVPKYVMTVNIDESESDPEASCTYSDDAVFMSAGSSGWDNLFGYKPCLFVNGAVSKYLNPNNFAQDASGNAVDITTLGNDVMIEFPKHGYKISKSGDIISVSLTNKPQAEGEAEGFCYKPFSRDAIGDRDYFYYGAYKSYSSGNKLYSSSGKAPTAQKTRATYRSEATARGTGYFQNGFYQLTYLQVLYLLKYKNRNSQAALGYGYVGGSSAQQTGATNTRGLNYGNTSSQTDRVKLFGIEDMWGNIWQWMDGILTDDSRKYVVTHLPVNFDDATSGTAHTTYESGITADLGGYISRVQGTTDCGFAAKQTSGSETTYWADYPYVKASRVASFGGAWSDGAAAGVFRLNVDDAASISRTYVTSRLMYV